VLARLNVERHGKVDSDFRKIRHKKLYSLRFILFDANIEIDTF
jgi:hypothetical protein